MSNWSRRFLALLVKRGVEGERVNQQVTIE